MSTRPTLSKIAASLSHYWDTGVDPDMLQIDERRSNPPEYTVIVLGWEEDVMVPGMGVGHTVEIDRLVYNADTDRFHRP